VPDGTCSEVSIAVPVFGISTASVMASAAERGTAHAPVTAKLRVAHDREQTPSGHRIRV
jgi:hypothetical protein